MSAPALSAASSVAAVDRPQILTVEIMRLFRANPPQSQRRGGGPSRVAQPPGPALAMWSRNWAVIASDRSTSAFTVWVSSVF